MWKEHAKSFCLSLWFGMLVSSCNYSNEDVYVVFTRVNDEYHRPCFLYYKNIKIKIVDVLHYRNSLLIERAICGSEGFFILSFNKKNKYSNEDMLVSNLKFSKSKNKIYFFDGVYNVEEERQDSIFTISDIDGEYVVFVRNKQ